MANLKVLRIRIASVKATQKITKAMQMVAASKLRRAQEAAEAGRPYAERMERMIASLAGNVAGRDDVPALLAGTGRDEVHLIVLATADRGLCGGFNSSLARAARRKIRDLTAAGKTVKLLCVGRKGRDALRRDYGSLIVDTIVMFGIKRITFAEQALPIGRTVVEMFEAGEFDICTIFYNRFQSALVQIVTEQQLVPTPMPALDQRDAAPGAGLGGATYEYEPDETEILADLLPRNVSVQIYRALLENAASEQGSRMTAMDSATRNAGDMIDRLTLTFNRERQAAITKELIEIISGAEAV